jgi:16S rRNA (adenine1518-N6/adenine1519-N6)-dimethyltransferase
MGQNFLIDGNVLDRIVDAAAPRPGAEVLEIGAGGGILTHALLEAGSRVCAVEKDPRLAALLRDRFREHTGFTLIEGDALDLNVEALHGRGIRQVVSNLPYAPGTRILVRLLLARVAFSSIVVTLQEEVAERACAVPGTSAFGLLGLWARRRYAVTMVRRIGPRCFYPAPEVDSALIRFDRDVHAAREPDDPEHFLLLTRWMFSQRRKQMGSLLRRFSPAAFREMRAVEALLEGLGIAAKSRPGDLDSEAWVRLSNRLRNLPGGDHGGILSAGSDSAEEMA